MHYAMHAVRAVGLPKSGNVVLRCRRCSQAVLRQLAVFALATPNELMLIVPSFLLKDCAAKLRRSFRRITFSWALAQDGCRPSVAVGVARHCGLFIGGEKIAFTLSLRYPDVLLTGRATTQSQNSRYLHGRCRFRVSCAQPGVRFPSILSLRCLDRPLVCELAREIHCLAP